MPKFAGTYEECLDQIPPRKLDVNYQRPLSLESCLIVQELRIVFDGRNAGTA